VKKKKRLGFTPEEPQFYPDTGDFVAVCKNGGVLWSERLPDEETLKFYKRLGYELRSITYRDHITLKRAKSLNGHDATMALRNQFRFFSDDQNHIAQRSEDPDRHYLEYYGVRV